MITGQTTKNTYQGDGSNRVWNISFEFTDSSQIKFKVNGQEVTTNFALNTVAKTLTYPTVASELDPLTSADEIIIYRDTSITQNIDFTNGGPLNAEMIEDGLDKLTMVAQEIKKKNEMVAGNGIDITDNIVSLKGVTTMPEGTDIDTLTTEGVYYIKSPTSTLGMPLFPNINTSKTGSYAIVRVTTPKDWQKGTYLAYQELVLIFQHIGVDSLGEPQVYSRYLSDYSYSTKNWVRLNNSLIAINKITDLNASIDVKEYKGCIVVLGAGTYFVPSTAITSLTLEGYYGGGDKTIVVFKAGYGFTLTVTSLEYWIGSKPTTFTMGSTYMITAEGPFLKCEEVIVE